MNDLDIRWKQRLESYRKALRSLTEAVDIARKRTLSSLEKQGLIKAFEFTFELAWTLIKDYLEYQGTTGITGSRDEDIAEEIFQAITKTYHSLFIELGTEMGKKADG